MRRSCEVCGRGLRKRKETMRENRLELEGGSLLWRENRGRATVLGMEGTILRLTVPDRIEEYPVTEIYKKAFFNCSSLRSLTLPDTLEEIGGWAFAHCTKLEQVRMPWKELRLGKDLFIGSERLSRIELRRVGTVVAASGSDQTARSGPEGNGVSREKPGAGGALWEASDADGALWEDPGADRALQEGSDAGRALREEPGAGGASETQEKNLGVKIAALLAAAAVRMEDPHLFSIADAGSEEWLKKWDARMLVILREPDAAGFEKNVLTGEEDYTSTDFNRFTNEKRRAKARLAFLRLLNPYGMPEEIRLELEDFLRSHTKGCPTEEAWEVLLLEHAEERPYYALFAELDCVTADNFDAILQDMKEEHPEMKAYLMRYKEEKLGYTDFFDSLSLDLF